MSDITPTPVPDAVKEGANVKDMPTYHATYKESMDDNAGFWKKIGKEQVEFFKEFDAVSSGTFKEGNVKWYEGGKLNAAYNCVDRHAKTNPDKVAILWEGDTPDQVRKITFKELQDEVSRCANALLSMGVKHQDTVTIYMPMVPEAAVCMLACARVGAVHSVVFAGFSAVALKDRIIDANSSVVLTSNVGLRGTKVIPLKKIVDEATDGLDLVTSIMVYKRTEDETAMKEGRDVWYQEIVPKQSPDCPPVHVDSEDLLFILYTSGSTGKPKGMAHSTAGYLVYSSYTCKCTFDLKDDTVHACVADVGWITGHSYIVYGPLVNGTTTFMFESVPTFPDAGRYWDMVQRHKLTTLYTAPTAIRALQRFGDEFPKKFDLSSLRVLGTVGEPINKEAWEWFKACAPQCSLVDTFWQTETGGHVVTGYAGCTPMKPGAASFPAFGIEPAILEAQSGERKSGVEIDGVLCIARPWPGVARTIYGDHDRYMATYLKAYEGYYFTGDGCHLDKDGYIWITGRVDDVVNVSGHRVGTAEVEGALVVNDNCAEAAVVGFPHDVKGEGIFCYCILAKGVENTPDMAKSFKMQVRKEIGAWCTPDKICIVPGLPKTRSGKIMRRILRKLAAGERDVSKLGDVSTLADSSVIDQLIAAVDSVA